MPTDTVQLQLIRRYSRLLREQQARSRGPRIGAKERREAQKLGPVPARPATGRPPAATA